MRIRWPFVLRSTMEAKLEAQLGRYNDLTGTKDWLIKAQDGVIAAQSAGLARLREHFDATVKAKDEAYRTLALERDGWIAKSDILDRAVRRLDDRLRSFGILPPYDWAAPLPCWLSSVVAADIHGVRGTIKGLADDPASGDPRRNLSLPMGLRPCPRPANNG